MHYFGFDIGGANIKWSDLNGNASEVPFAIWQTPERLPAVLATITANFPSNAKVGVTMTAELADCFETKREGVKFVVDSVVESLSQFYPLFYQTSGNLCTGSAAIDNWDQTAAANWHATSSYLFSIDPLIDSGFVLDIGSTTTDIIPVTHGAPVTSHQNDLERLSNGQLVYAGVGRTPVFGISTEFQLRDSLVTIARENFATMADVFRALNETPEELDSNETADGRPASRHYSCKRIARLVCADSEELEIEEIESISIQVKAEFISLLARQLNKVIQLHPEVPQVFQTLGRGTFITDAIIQKSLTESVSSMPTILPYSDNIALNQSVPALAVAHFRAQFDLRN